jgi:broad specificity phosphatase PhoE
MKPIHLTLISHAQTDAQRLGRFHRTDDGVRTLPGLASSAVKDSARLLTAPELRARQTAQGLGWAAQVEDCLRDCDFGTWQGLELTQLEPHAVQQWLGDPTAAPHGGESVEQLCQRIAHWMDALEPGHWLAVTHPFVIRAALLHALGSQLATFQKIDVHPLAEVQFSRFGNWKLRLA